MRNLLLAGFAGLMLAGPALADDRDWRDQRRDDRHEWRDDRRDDRRDWREDRRDWRDDRRDDWRSSGARYRGPVYNYPRGYGYRPWDVGYRLPPAYFDQRYRIADPGYYRLPRAGWGTRWVRVGPDALLIGRDGIILRAVRGLYW